MSLRQAAVILLSTIALAATLLEWPVPLRPIAVYPFVLLGPGLAITGLLRLRDSLMELTLVVIIGLCAQTVIATLFVYAGVYSAELVLVTAVILAISALVAGAHIRPLTSRRFPADEG